MSIHVPFLKKKKFKCDKLAYFFVDKTPYTTSEVEEAVK